MIKTSSSRIAPKWLRVLLPSVLIVAWFAIAGIGGPYFGKISEVSSNDQSTFLPASAESTKVNNELKKFQNSGTIPAIFIFTRNNETLSDTQISGIKEASQKLKSVDGLKGDVSPPVTSDDGKAALVLVNVDSSAEFKTLLPELKSKFDTSNLTVDYKVTGPVGFLSDLTKAFSGIDGILLLVALAVVFTILLIVYRSPFLPFIVLLNAMSALAASIFVVWHLANAGVVQINGQVQGILFILVIGAATDYSLLFVSRYREELEKHKRTWQAIIAALKGSFEPIVAAGGTVIVGLLCLLLSDLNSNKALGPVGAIGIALAVISALTFLPAMLLATGRRVFWPRTPRYDQAKLSDHHHATTGLWARIAGLVSSRPRALWIGTTVLLLVCGTAILTLKADGIPQSEVVLGTSEARDGQKLLDTHFPGGSGAPAYITATSPDIAKLTTALEADKGVASVSVTANNSSSGMLPLGKAAADILVTIRQQITTSLDKQKAAIRSEIESRTAGAPAEVTEQAYQSAVASIPSVDSLADQAYPFKDAVPKVVGGEILLQATLRDSADSKNAQDTITRLRSTVKQIDGNAKVGGTTAVQLDTNTASLRDREVVIPAILIVITIILMVLLRSVLAPVLLLLTTIVSFAATLGISALLFNNVWHYPGADSSVILYAFVFLVALGIDYNIFLMTRIREESLKIGTRKGVVKGLVITGAVITSAGVVLAATFAALSVIPVLFLVQLAFIVAFGVLLDTTIVRSLLVPALIYDIGNHSWWPSKWHNK